MDKLNTAMNDHLDQMQEIVEKISSKLQIGMQPAMDNFIGFFHAIDWKVNTLFLLCQLIVKWKRAELKHRARLSTTKQD
ncbi:hypothetical protein R6Q57_003899 [Mikania cordata]